MHTERLNKRKAFEQESFPHLDALWRIARWLTTRNGLAEEIVMNTMIRAYGGWPYADVLISYKTRLFQILTREIFGFGTQRQNRNHSRQFLSENISITADYEGGNARNTLSEFDQLQLKIPNDFSEESVRRIIARLRPQTRLTLLLLYIGKFSYADIAFIMDLSRNSVQLILTRGRKLVRIHMLEYAERLGKNATSQMAFISHSAELKVESTNVLSRPMSSSRIDRTDASFVEWESERGTVFGQDKE